MALFMSHLVNDISLGISSCTSVIIGFMGLPWDSKIANLLDPEEAETAAKLSN